MKGIQLSHVLFVSLSFIVCFGFLQYFKTFNILEDDVVTANENDDWDYLEFAQQWPPTVCTTKKCAIPSYIDQWVIHGLWPTDNHGYPQFCNKSWPFVESKIEPIIGELEHKWPNVFKDASESSFWKHEWTKHGTCAASLPILHGEKNYFNTSIILYDKFNFYESLSSAGIIPTQDKEYSVESIHNAIENIVQKTVKIECTKEKYKSPLFFSVQICLDKSLTPINCISTDSSCGESVIYLPYQ